MRTDSRPRPPTIALVGALDTKGLEYGFVRDRIARSGLGTLLVDTGVLGDPQIAPDIDSTAVAMAGGGRLDSLVAAADRGAAVTAMSRGAASIVRERVLDGSISGVIVLGGSNAGFIMSRIAEALPIGVPKVLVSTIVAGDTRPYVGVSDLTMMYPVEDIAGLNSVTTPMLARAADACVGMVRGAVDPPAAPTGPVIGLSMFGVTTQCVAAVCERAVEHGFEPHVFHANGTGGRTLEAMIRSGAFDAVADLTTTELADEMLGGVCSAGPERLTAAGSAGVPQVVSVGALDMVNFGPLETVPPQFTARRLHAHNPFITLMRTSVVECRRLGALLAERINASTGPVEVHVPLRGFSQISVPGQPFHDPEADAALVEALREVLAPSIPLSLHDAAINDPGFAVHVGSSLQRLLKDKDC